VLHYIPSIFPFHFLNFQINQAGKKNSKKHPLTPSNRIETGSSLEVSRTCTSPVTGSSISPVSPATLDLKLTKTSAAAVSNYKTNTHTRQKPPQSPTVQLIASQPSNLLRLVHQFVPFSLLNVFGT
jgi:hypothetical protein